MVSQVRTIKNSLIIILGIDKTLQSFIVNLSNFNCLTFELGLTLDANDKFSDWSILKALADNIVNVT